MGIKSIAAKWIARREVDRISAWSDKPLQAQEKTFRHLISVASTTAFGKEHRLNAQDSMSSFQSKVPVRDYEALKPWVEQIIAGQENVLWTGKPLYFCKTSGTTSGTKYIPMSEEGIKAQVRAARSALLCYIHETGNAAFIDGKMIFLQGSPALEKKKGISIGRLSGIVAHHVPSYLQRNRMPSWETNCEEDWETKVNAIVKETASADLRLVSGIPPWVHMYFERLLAFTGKSTVREVFPNLSVFAHGGVNYAPYKAAMEKLIGGSIDTIETYPASEGFIAFQDKQQDESLLLNLDAGIFYEFIPAEEVHAQHPKRLTLGEVELNKQYAIVLSTTSGLWAYLIGDLVRFTSLSPFKIVVSGRVKHFISAFGEHVIGEEVERALTETAKHFNISIDEFHVAPQVNPADGLPYHEWFIESDQMLSDDFAASLDERMRSLNSYYNDLITGAVLRPLVITSIRRGSFNRFMESQGKLGGQNKLPRLANDRGVADKLK